MQNIILFDSNLASKLTYDYLKEIGDNIFVVGNNDNDFLAKTAINYINLDYSDVDSSRDLLKDLNIDFIVPGCNDVSYLTCAELNTGEFLGLDSLAVSKIINSKQEFRDFAKNIGLRIPKVFLDSGENIEYPVIVKPVDAYSGRGVSIISEKSELQDAIHNATKFSKTKTCIIEEYVEGQLFSHSAFLQNGAITIDFIVEEYGTANPFVVDTSRVVYDFPVEVLNEIRRDICKLAKELDLVDGLIHTQFIKNKNSFWIIEITRRCPGDLYSFLIEASTGFKYAETYAKFFLQQEVDIKIEGLFQKNIIRHTISMKKEGNYNGLEFRYPLSILRLLPLCQLGDKLKASPFGRAALLFISCQSRTEQDLKLKIILNRELYYFI
jgi:biotin carboxylase